MCSRNNVQPLKFILFKATDIIRMINYSTLSDAAIIVIIIIIIIIIIQIRVNILTPYLFKL